MERIKYQIKIVNKFQALGENESSPEVHDDSNSLWEVIDKTEKEVANKISRCGVQN